MAKTLLFSAGPGSVAPEEGVNTIEVVDWDTPIGLIVETTRMDDRLLLVRKNGAGTSINIPVTDSKGEVYLQAKHREVTLSLPDVYGLRGYLKGTINVYKVV